jgi:predicted glycosyltransferase
VPVYSIFRGKIGAVDRYLEETGRLSMIESVADVHAKIKLVRWNRPARPADRNRPVLDCIVQTILSVLKSQRPHRGSEATVTPAKAILPQQS